VTKQKVGVLHPGQMGVVVAQTIRNSGHEVYWASEGRGAETARRAVEAGLTDAGSVKRMAEICAVIVSVCPPEFAEGVATNVTGAGFRGLYLDVNAIAPERARRIERLIRSAGASFVDGAIIGMPARARGQTWLYVSGENAGGAAPLFQGGPLEFEVLGDLAGQASALKMCFAAYSKGTTALLAAVLGAADALGVQGALERQWARTGPNYERAVESVRTAAPKAWRFTGEMREIADTLASVGVPAGFPKAAGEIYEKLRACKGAGQPEIAEILRKLRE
jgi:3-hydroxyisobutyrate dehydrogenase-like beta-hydroxyacid dehydrogenase